MGRLDALDLTPRLGRKEYERAAASPRSGAGCSCACTSAARWAPASSGPGLLVVFEGSDAAGKGGAIKRLVEPLDPRHYRVTSFAKPTFDEKRHPSCGASTRTCPGLGGMSVFDRSWYGRVLVERVEGFATTDEWGRAYEEIVGFERTIVTRGRDPRQVLAADQRRGAAAPVRGPPERSAAALEDHRRGLAQPQEGRPVRASPPRRCSSAPTTTSRRGTSSRASRSATPGCAVLETLIKRVEQGMRALGHAGAAARRAAAATDPARRVGARRRGPRAVDCHDARRDAARVRTAGEPRRRGGRRTRSRGRTSSSSTSTPAASTSPTS